MVQYNLEIELVHKIVKVRLSPHRGTLALLFTKCRSLGNHDKIVWLPLKYSHNPPVLAGPSTV